MYGKSKGNEESASAKRLSAGNLEIITEKDLSVNYNQVNIMRKKGMNRNNLEKLDDKSLIIAGSNGDFKEATAILYKRYNERITNFIKKSLYEKEIAEDLTNETFIRVFNKLKDYSPDFEFLGDS